MNWFKCILMISGKNIQWNTKKLSIYLCRLLKNRLMMEYNYRSLPLNSSFPRRLFQWKTLHFTVVKIAACSREHEISCVHRELGYFSGNVGAGELASGSHHREEYWRHRDLKSTYLHDRLRFCSSRVVSWCRKHHAQGTRRANDHPSRRANGDCCHGVFPSPATPPIPTASRDCLNTH